MPALAQVSHAEPEGPDGSRLADEIARAMHYRPLMSRLARVETAFTEPDGTSAPPLVTDGAFAAAGAAIADSAPPPIPQSAAALPATFAYSASIEELIADAADSVTSVPPTADWLDKARRERQRARMRNVGAWLTTLAIAGSIFAAALLMLRT